MSTIAYSVIELSCTALIPDFVNMLQSKGIFLAE